MNQYMIMFTTSGSPVQYRIIASSKTAQEVAAEFMRRRKRSRFVGIYSLKLEEVKL